MQPPTLPVTQGTLLETGTEQAPEKWEGRRKEEKKRPVRGRENEGQRKVIQSREKERIDRKNSRPEQKEKEKERSEMGKRADKSSQ